MIWLYAIWREYYCPWPGLPQLCHCMAVRRTARVSLHLAWVNSSLLSYGRTLHGASIIAFVLSYFIFAIVWLNIMCCEYHCLWPGLIRLYYHMAVRRMAPVLLSLAWELLEKVLLPSRKSCCRHIGRSGRRRVEDSCRRPRRVEST